MIPREVSLPPDEELVAGLKAGDEQIFAAMVDGWSASMLRVARSFVGSAASAEDVVQDTWMAVVQGIGGFEGRSALRTWVFRILVNTARRRGVREHRTVPVADVRDEGPAVDAGLFRRSDDPEYPGHWLVFPVAWPSTEGAALAAEIRTTLHALVETLPARQRVVLTLRDIEGRPADEVGSLLEISAGNQRVLLHRARAVVRAGLAEYFAASGGRP